MCDIHWKIGIRYLPARNQTGPTGTLCSSVPIQASKTRLKASLTREVDPNEQGTCHNHNTRQTFYKNIWITSRCVCVPTETKER